MVQRPKKGRLLTCCLLEKIPPKRGLEQTQIVQALMLFFAAVIVAPSAWGGGLPNPMRTPGATNPAVTQANIQQTICVPGYSRSIRPPEDYTERLKRAQIRAYGYRDRYLRDYEEDHLIPLSIGGSPTDPRNLWPEPRHGRWNARKKDRLEYVLYKKVCRGEISLRDAQQGIRTHWPDLYREYVPSRREHTRARW